MIDQAEFERPAHHGVVHHDERPEGLSTCRCGLEASHVLMAAHLRATFDPDVDDLPAVAMIRIPSGEIGWTYHCGIEDCCPDWPRGPEA